jgi:hypothetical protein
VGGIFISYRGQDSGTTAALIDRELTAWFGRDLVFLAGRSISVGVDFVDELLRQLRACSVLLALIGPCWLSSTDEAGQRRIDNSADWVRREIAEASAHGLRVIPVLLDGTKLPAVGELPHDIAWLSRRQYVVLRPRCIDVDLADLVERIVKVEPELARAAGIVCRRGQPGSPGRAVAHLCCRARSSAATPLTPRRGQTGRAQGAARQR